MKVAFKCVGVIAMALAVLVPGPAGAVPIAVDPGIISLSTFDTGGFLDLPAAGFELGGLEVDPTSGTVYVLASDAPAGGTSTTVQLISSTGLGTAAPVGLPVPFKLNARGYDLTMNSADGKLYAAGTLTPALGPIHGIHGFDPAGIAPPVTFAGTTSGFSTSGLTFDAAGTRALVSTDGVDAAVLPNGLYSVPGGGPEAVVVGAGVLPVGVGPTDDHVVTPGGKTIVAGDGSHELWDVTGGAGAVSLLIDLNTIPAVLPALGGAGGNRATVDPCSGDIFYAHALAPGSPGIIRIKADGSAATVFALGFTGIRDIDFGPASSGSGGDSLYVTEVDLGVGGGLGSIYEFEINCIPEPSTVALLGIGLLSLALLGRRKR